MCRACVLAGLFQVLVDAGAVGLDRLRLPNHVIRRLNEATAQRQAQLNDAIMAQREAAGAAEKRKETDARDVNEEEEEEDDEGEGEEDREAEMAERDDLIQSLRGATFQCLFAMFGVDLPQRNTQWGDCDGRLVPGAGTAAGVHQQQRGSSLAGAMAMARDGDDAEGASREMWLEVWKCLGTLLRGHGKTGKRHRNPAKVTKVCLPPSLHTCTHDLLDQKATQGGQPQTILERGHECTHLSAYVHAGLCAWDAAHAHYRGRAEARAHTLPAALGCRLPGRYPQAS